MQNVAVITFSKGTLDIQNFGSAHFLQNAICRKKIAKLAFVVVVVYFILSRLFYLAFSANLGLLCMPHPSMGPLV